MFYENENYFSEYGPLHVEIVICFFAVCKVFLNNLNKYYSKKHKIVKDKNKNLLRKIVNTKNVNLIKYYFEKQVTLIFNKCDKICHIIN